MAIGILAATEVVQKENYLNIHFGRTLMDRSNPSEEHFIAGRKDAG
jgi:hypothetical protein